VAFFRKVGKECRQSHSEKPLFSERLSIIIGLSFRRFPLKRLIDAQLVDWKAAPRRKPLLVRGARQVGKTWSLRRFGEQHFGNLAAVDLERNRDWHQLFSGDLNPRRILTELEVLLDQKITPGETLLFLDEIQSCPRAIMALRYFFEELPELHVVGAGSLLEFALQDISFPVGRVQFLEMHPLIFAEYLWAVGKMQAAEIVLAPPTDVGEAVHAMLLEDLRTYCFVGGMPESVRAFAERQSIQESFDVHRELCDSYRQDFSKYAPRADKACLDAVFSGLARNLGKPVKYSRLAQGYSHPTIKKALDLLCMARVVKKVPAANPSGMPLAAGASAGKFKAIFVDVGLWQHLSGMRADIEFAKADLLDIYEGAMAEQFVGQELMVSQASDLFYWAREARSSNAEVDYLAVVDETICPVEVKSGAAGKLKSLHLLLQTYPNCPRGLVFSCGRYAELPAQKLSFLPLYYAFSATTPRSR
jgi:predicted AAA+ superfamily ATPase